MPCPEHVLDLFAVPAVDAELPGGSGGSVLAGDLVLSPGRDAAVMAWLSPVLARLSAELDESRSATERFARSALRLAMPVPARDGSWVVDGWGATRYEPGTTPCDSLDVLVATGRLLSAHLASAVGRPNPALAARADRWARAERLAFGEDALDAHPSTLVRRLADARTDDPLGPDQLVHADLAGNVLFDAAGLPFVIDIAPAWRPALWAEAVCVLDAVMWQDADPLVMREWAHGRPRQAMVRAALFRLLADDPADVTRYAQVLAPIWGSARG